MEASRLGAMEALSRKESGVLFDDGGIRDSLLSPNLSAKATTRRCSSAREGDRGQNSNNAIRPKSRLSLEERLRLKVTTLVEEERGRLGCQLRRELGTERRRFEAGKSTIAEESCREARLEQSMALQKLEHELRTLLARRELKSLKDAAYRQLLIDHDQQRERTLLRLRRSLGRGLGHSVSGLRGELWREAQEKHQRALKEGDAAFGHSCKALRQQWNRNTQSKIEAMAREAANTEEAAIAELRIREAQVAEEDFKGVLADLEWEKHESEAELKHQLQRDASRTLNAAVDDCTSIHKQSQLEAASRASWTLKHSLEAAEGIEAARTRSTIERESRLQEDRGSALVAAVEDALRDCYLRNIAKRSLARSPAPYSLVHLPESGRPKPLGEDKRESWLEPAASANEHCLSFSKKAFGIVQGLEDTAIAAEQEYSNRARRMVRLQAAVALRRQDRETGGAPGVERTSTVFRRERGVAPKGRGISCRPGEGEVASCGGCAELLEANERLLEEATYRGFCS